MISDEGQWASIDLSQVRATEDTLRDYGRENTNSNMQPDPARAVRCFDLRWENGRKPVFKQGMVRRSQHFCGLLCTHLIIASCTHVFRL